MAEILIRKEDLADLLRAIAELYPSADDLRVIMDARIKELQIYKDLFTDLIGLNADILRPNRYFLFYNKRKERLLDTYSLAFEALLLFKDMGIDPFSPQHKEVSIWELLKLLLYKAYGPEA